MSTITLTAGDLALRRRDRKAQLRWEQAMRPQRNPFGIRPVGLGGAYEEVQAQPHRPVAAVSSMPPAAARGSASAAVAIPRPTASRATYRRAAIAASLISGAGAALAATAITKGYMENDEAKWEQRIAERTHSPIFGRDNTLIGSVGLGQNTLSLDEAREYAFVPLQGDVPDPYLRALIDMENKNYFAGGWHNICGLDIPASLKRWIVNPGAGGSTLSMQLARGLMQPAWGKESSFFSKAWRKGLEIGASCRLHTMLAKQGGRAAFLKLYASYAATAQGNGTLRGLEAGSRIIFDRAPQELSDGQQLIFAGAAFRPIPWLPPGAEQVGCSRVYPEKGNPQYEPSTAKDNRARAVQCQLIQRAIFHAPHVLEGQRLDKALAELREYLEKGIHPANPFEPIPAKRVINLASRTAAALPQGLLPQIQKEADDEALMPGEPLYVSIDAIQQHAFHQAMLQTLDQIQRTSYMRRTLCLPLVNSSKPLAKAACAVNDGVPNADVLAIKADVVSGGIGALYATTPLLLGSNHSIGSLAKIPVIVAALAEGYKPSDLLCPKAARDGQRPLKRASAPEYGFANCAGGRNLMTLERATATSDNLAYYELAQKLGEKRLAAAARALELGDPTRDKLAYELAFGTFGAKPRQVISAFQALFAIAYGMQTTGQAPRALRNVSAEENPAIAGLRSLLPRQDQRDALRVLLEAPVQTAGGTLAFLKGQVSAGKTGTVQSAVRDANGRLFNHAKWSVTYRADDHSLNLLLVASPTPSIPLAQHDLGAKSLLPAQMLILKSEKS